MKRIVVLIALVSVLAGIVVGVGLAQRISHSRLSTPATAVSRDTTATAQELAGLRHTASALRSSLSFALAQSSGAASELRLEPASDLSRAQLEGNITFLATIRKVSTHPLAVSLDVETQRLEPPGGGGTQIPIYVNRHVHVQTLKVQNPYIPVVFMVGAAFGMPPRTLPLEENPGSSPAATYEEFVDQVNRNSTTLSKPGIPPEGAYLYQVWANSDGVYQIARVYQQ